MKNGTYLSALILTSVFFLLAACSVEKRLHRPGYHVDLAKSNFFVAKKNKKSKTNEDSKNKKEIELNKFIDEEVVSAKENIALERPLLISNTKSEINKKKGKLKQKTAVVDQECDIIIFKDGTEVEAVVIEVGVYEVKYKKCDNINGPTFSNIKSNIFMIKYSNGTKTVIEKEPDSRAKNDSKESQSSTTYSYNNKSVVVAVILWFFFGLLGIHRFYLGYPAIGILYLLTGALCGIGFVVDGILFLVGGLKPKGGQYID